MWLAATVSAAVIYIAYLVDQSPCGRIGGAYHHRFSLSRLLPSSADNAMSHELCSAELLTMLVFRYYSGYRLMFFHSELEQIMKVLAACGLLEQFVVDSGQV